MTSYRERSIALLLCATTAALSHAAFGLSLQTLQSSIKTKKAKWQAGQTSVSVLSESEVKKMLGAKFETDRSVLFRPARVNTTNNVKPTDFPFPFPFPFPDDDDDDNDDTDTSLPASWSWRNQNGVDYASPMLDQGRCGSCVAFAVVGALETQMNISRSTTFSPWQFSPQHLFSCGGGSCDRGWTPSAAMGYLQKTGVPDESCFPYESGVSGKDMACNASCSDSKDRSETIASYATEAFLFKSVAKLKKAITKGPVVATMMVYEDFIYYTGGVYEHTTGKQLGGHAVTLMGYDDKEGAFLVRNSWGPSWGEQGYFRIKYEEDSDIGANAYSMNVGKGDGFVTAKGIRDNAVLAGKVALALHSTYPDTSRIDYEVFQGKVSVASGNVATNTSTDLDTTTLPDGTYMLKTSATTKSNTETGQDRKINILNGKLTGTVKFTSVKDGDSITGEKMLDIEVTTKPFIPTAMTFYFKELKTKDESFRTTTNVGAKMNLNWRTDPRPKGDYEIWLVAEAGGQTLKSDVLKVTLK